MHGLVHLPTSDRVHATACSLETENFSLEKGENNIHFKAIWDIVASEDFDYTERTVWSQPWLFIKMGVSRSWLNYKFWAKLSFKRNQRAYKHDLWHTNYTITK